MIITRMKADWTHLPEINNYGMVGVVITALVLSVGLPVVDVDILEAS